MYLCRQNNKRYGEIKSNRIAINKRYRMDVHIHTIHPFCLILLVQTDFCKVQASVSVDTKRTLGHL